MENKVPGSNLHKYDKQGLDKRREKILADLRRQNYFSITTFIFTGFLATIIGNSQSELLKTLGFMFMFAGLLFLFVFFIKNKVKDSN